uniref:phosphoenolpyruvate--protein phosphotransferase n=2 Tax=Cyanobacteriota TaxID=1117 RepID=UPI001F556B22|nr:phosphoenolpyruvate--protein phosphotransferase [Coleofasciculus sp. FACHB-SPT9]
MSHKILSSLINLNIIERVISGSGGEMVGIVIVSHSRKLAEGVQALVQQMVQGTVSLALAAGIDDPENPFGTDAMQVYQAIESVYSEDGVLILMDLGSAVLSAEMALEFLPEERRHQVRLCEAPLVEGAIAAAVTAASGANIEQVIREARGALAAKASQLSGINPSESAGALVSAPISAQSQVIHLTVRNQMGLHARPAAKFVATASQFQSEITLQNITSSSGSVNAKSINQVVTLVIRQGNEIAIAASGADAQAALAALQQLVEANFGESVAEVRGGETPLPEQPQFPISNSQFSGIPASAGIAIGNIASYQPTVLNVKQQADNPEAEWQQLHTAIEQTRHQIQTLRHQISATAGEAQAAIFDAHLLCLEDPFVIDRTRQLIFARNYSAAAAWKTVIDETVAAYEALPDSYLQARAADVFDVGQRVMRSLTGTAPASINLPEPGILVATDLTPSETAQLDPGKVLGICTVAGGATSHSGILARSLGIPAVVGVGAELLRLQNGTLIALDGETGEVWVQPDDTQLQELQAKRNRQQAQQQALQAAAQQPAITHDGHQIKVMANILTIQEAKIAVNMGAEGVGLLRSEFLYFDRVSVPTEEEQREAYEAIASILSPHPLIIRTLDIGGDKPLPYLNLPPEANPFLGWRGIRFLLDSPDLLKTQLRAILRASHQNSIKVMFPMVASVREIRAAKEILAAAKTELRSLGMSFDEAMEVGIMVEVPAAVTMADKLAAEVDFFSIGTNDLSQYVMASDRTNPKVATLADAFEPAVLRMIQQTVTAAHHAGIWVGVCGELASSELATPILVGLGVDEFSMNSPAISTVKAAISKLRMDEAEAIASAVLQLDSAKEVREYIAGQLKT